VHAHSASGASRQDYERIALSGIKRIGAATDPGLVEAIDRLVEQGLAERDGQSLSLLPPAECEDPEDVDLFRALRDVWLRADDVRDEDRLLYGELGYWMHWADLLREREAREDSPLRMDVVVADDAEVVERDWLSTFDPEVVEHVVSHQLVTGRVILPPRALDTPTAELVPLAMRLGFQVRVFPSPSHYVVYDGEFVVLREEAPGDPLEGHRLTRRRAVVDPMRHLFSLQWSAAMPWQEYEKGAAGILALLSRGWTDTRIAAAMNVSVRTVSRRVTEAMRAAGVQSRFELGMRYARGELGGPTP